MAPSASRACGPRAVTSMVLPCSAASIITPMMLRPFTTWPSFAIEISASNFSAVFTSSTAARACRPSRFLISRLALCSSVVPAPIPVRDVAGSRRGGRRRPEAVLLPVALDEAGERVRVHLTARRRELDEDRHVRACDHLGARLARDGEALVGGRVAEHVGHDDDAAAVIGAVHRGRDARPDRLRAVA